MDQDNKDFVLPTPERMKPEYSKTGTRIEVGAPMTTKKKSWKSRIGWTIILVLVVLVLIQYFNAAKYSALVQVIAEDKIGVNPTGERLDFGDLPRNKSAVRTVTLESKGNTGSYIIIWKYGAISDFINISKNYFTLSPHTTEKLEFTVHTPNSADYKYYKGQVIIFQIPKIW